MPRSHSPLPLLRLLFLWAGRCSLSLRLLFAFLTQGSESEEERTSGPASHLRLSPGQCLLLQTSFCLNLVLLNPTTCSPTRNLTSLDHRPLPFLPSSCEARMKPGMVGYLLAAALFCSTQGRSPSRQPPAGVRSPVVPFEEVWSRSYCHARETLVDVHSAFPDEVEHIFKPPCVPLWRCAGCCGDESLECVAVETRTIDLEVLRVSPILGTIQQEELTFTEHMRCVCRSRRKRLKSEKNHRMGTKRKPRVPSPPVSPPLCQFSMGRRDTVSGGWEETPSPAETHGGPLPPRAVSL
ncbi:snake venom vascular endothelial growth factor toxin barietin-like [Candoia aspera]|uniref:snake venom vascular endothelial growth factor toxin barietin-like n=1 Tax=Candoia aspera TaxID=51853 RepID=UPI002FD7FC4A